MISSSPRKLRARIHVRGSGFTLVELLVVMGIIVLLIALLLPAINRAYRESARARIASDLHVISQALDTYKRDFGDYPRPGKTPGGKTVTGASILCWALIAPGPAGDGNGNPEGSDGFGDSATTNPNPTTPGPGFRIRGTQGQVWGPYLNVDHFKVGPVDGTGNVESGSGITYNDALDVIADMYGHPILYYVANTGADPTVNFVASTAYGSNSQAPPPVFNYFDNQQYCSTGSNPNNVLTLQMFEWRLGDGHYPDVQPNGRIDKGENAVTTGPYLLLSAGPDGAYGTDDDVANVTLNGPFNK